VSSDRWWAYGLIDSASHQACWEHLKRDFAFHAAGALAEQKRFGEAGGELTKRVFETWHAFGEHSDRERLAGEMTPIQAELRELLKRAARKSTYTRSHRRFARNLLKIWPALWTFVTVEGVEPTNNAAPRERYADRSSTASSRTAPNQTTASNSSSGRSQPRSHAARKATHRSPTCASCSAPTPAVTHPQRWPETQPPQPPTPSPGTERLQKTPQMRGFLIGAPRFELGTSPTRIASTGSLVSTKRP
jgi:hypothetical protein